MHHFLHRLIPSTRQCSSIFTRRHVAHFTFFKDQPDPALGLFPLPLFSKIRNSIILGATKEMNLCQTIQNTLDITLANDNTASNDAKNTCDRTLPFFLVLQLFSAKMWLSVEYFAVR